MKLEHIKLCLVARSPVLPVGHPDKKICAPCVPKIVYIIHLTPGLPAGRLPGHRRDHRPIRSMFMCLFLSWQPCDRAGQLQSRKTHKFRKWEKNWQQKNEKSYALPILVLCCKFWQFFSYFLDFSGKRKTHTSTSPPAFSRKAMPWGKNGRNQ